MGDSDRAGSAKHGCSVEENGPNEEGSGLCKTEAAQPENGGLGNKRQKANDAGARKTLVQGYLRKSAGGERRSWRKRWFVLKDALFTSFKGSGAKAPQSIMHVGGGSVSLEDGDGGIKCNLSLSTARGRGLLLAAAKESDAAAWYDALSSACLLPPPPDEKQGAAESHEQIGSDDEKENDSGGINSGGLPVLLVLDVTGGPCEGSRFEVGSDGVTILRKPTGLTATHHKVLKQLQLPDADISRQHAEIKCAENLFSIRDLGSLNGTSVNDQRLSAEKKKSEWKTLKGGDTLVMGKSVMSVFFRVKVPDAPPSLEEQERRRRRAERRDKRDERRKERREKLGRPAQGGEKRAREEAPRSRSSAGGGGEGGGGGGLGMSLGGGGGPSSRIAATAELFLQGVLGSAGRAPPAASVGGGGQGGDAGSLRPNTAALSSIVGGVLDHNERVKEEGEAAAKRRRDDLGLPPPPLGPPTGAPAASPHVHRLPPFPPPPPYASSPYQPPHGIISQYISRPQNPSLVPSSAQSWAPAPPAYYSQPRQPAPWNTAPWAHPPPTHPSPAYPPPSQTPPSPAVSASGIPPPSSASDAPAPGEGSRARMEEMQLPTKFGGK